MLRLDLSTEPRWYDMPHGVRLRLRPLTSALMLSVQADVAHLPAQPDDAAAEADPDEPLLRLVKAVARRAVIEWEGVGDAGGNPVPPSPEGIDALMDVFAIFRRFYEAYFEPGDLLDAEKNVCAPSPNGSSAGAESIAAPATDPARTAPGD